MSSVNVDTVIKGFVKLRDKRAALRKTYQTEDDALKLQQDKLETYLLGMMQKTGADNLGSPNGTAYKQVKTKGSASDWSTAWDWMAENKRLDMLEKRVSVKVVQEYYEETGTLPPGIVIDQELKVIVRRSK